MQKKSFFIIEKKNTASAQLCKLSKIFIISDLVYRATCKIIVVTTVASFISGPELGTCGIFKIFQL